MIECTNNYIWYKRKHRKRSIKRCFYALIVFIISLASISYYYNVTCKCIYNICKEYVYSYSTESVNLAILNSLNNNIMYSDLIYIEKNSENQVILLTTNTVKINYIKTMITNETTKILKEKLNEGIPIPLLAFSGVNILSGYGNRINFKSLSISSVSCKFDSTFISQGLNQTLHSIYIIVNTSIYVNMPFNNQKIEFSTQVLISEAIIVGKVPDIYFKDSIFR